MKKVIPMPIHTLVLFISWLLLNDTLAPGHILLAAVLAFGIPKLIEPMMSKQRKIVKPMALVKYILVLLWDIVVANLKVAKLVIGRNSALRPGLLAYPLEIEGNLPVTLLAATISLTPGTLSAELSKDGKWLYIHTLDMDTPDSVVAEIKARYETPLKEIFGC